MQPDPTVAPPSLPALWRIAPDDDVAVALRPLAEGEDLVIEAVAVRARADIPAGHKIALRACAAGQEVRKYGWPIGRATADIAPGDHVHSHNLATQLTAQNSYTFVPASQPKPRPLAGVSPWFSGYPRRDGRVGTRNEIWILPTVGCAARTAEKIARIAHTRFHGRVDGVHAFTHPFGCSQLGADLARTRDLLAALAQHPNAGGVLLVGLGCESNQLADLLAAMPGHEPERIRSFAAQESGDEIADGLEAIDALVQRAETVDREEVPLSKLVVGLKCGGSDGFSGLTANPVLGRVADHLTWAGGTAVLTEIPEIFGAEQLLLARARDEQQFASLADLVNRFKRYFIEHGQPVHENPSPGNIAGGITTLEEKSLGAVQKGGSSLVTQVLPYGGRASEPGLALLEAPGNDAVSATALAAAGATLILFTTGRGTPLGFPVPTLKVASNSALARRKQGWIDFDAGPLLAGTAMPDLASALLHRIVETASGARTCNELNDEREMAIWKDGVTL